jgi:hypothetical protein
MSIKAAFEVLVEILNRVGAQLGKNGSNFPSVVYVRITAILGRDQRPITAVARLVNVWSVIVPVAQDKIQFGRQLID